MASSKCFPSIIATDKTPPSGLNPHVDFFFLVKFGLDGGNRSVLDFEGARFLRMLEDDEAGRRLVG